MPRPLHDGRGSGATQCPAMCPEIFRVQRALPRWVSASVRILCVIDLFRGLTPGIELTTTTRCEHEKHIDMRARSLALSPAACPYARERALSCGRQDAARALRNAAVRCADVVTSRADRSNANGLDLHVSSIRVPS